MIIFLISHGNHMLGALIRCILNGEIKTYVVIPHLNHLEEMVQMRDHNICFYAEFTRIIPNYHQILLLI